MMTLCLGARMTQSARHWLSVLLDLAAFATPAIADEPIAVRLDQAAVLKLPERAATVVIGNPLIADVSIQPGGIAVVTGKGYGATNVIAMDHSGAVMMEKIVEVRKLMGPRRGLSRRRPADLQLHTRLRNAGYPRRQQQGRLGFG